MHWHKNLNIITLGYFHPSLIFKAKAPKNILFLSGGQAYSVKKFFGNVFIRIKMWNIIAL
jgi:hypothetical protein